MTSRIAAASITAFLVLVAGSLAAPARDAYSAPAGPPPPAAAVVALEDPVLTLDPCGVCYRLTFLPSGSGSGRIRSTNADYVPDGKIDCLWINQQADPASCTNRFEVQDGGTDAKVWYLVTPASGSTAKIPPFTGHDDEQQYGDLLSHDWQYNVIFDLKSYDIVVTKSGTGSGRVVATPDGVNCGQVCAGEALYGTSILLTAVPEDGSTFKNWTGACAGQPKDCLIAIIGNTTTNAVFASNTTATGGPGATNPPGTTVTAGPVEPTGAPDPSSAPSAPAPSAVSASDVPLSTAGPGASPDTQPAAGQGAPPFLALVIVGGGIVGALIGLGAFYLRRPRRGAP